MKKNNKLKILYFIFLILPFIVYGIFYKQLPDMLPVHYNINGVPDSYYSKNMACFGIPAILVAMNLFCIFITQKDPKWGNVNKKMIYIIYALIPLLNLLICGYTIYYGLGYRDLNISTIMILLIGILFIVIGNYMPKSKQSYTVGIKLPWTLNSEENWNKTHRLAGFLWTIGGIITCIIGFTKYQYLFFGVIIIIAIIPSVYSYLLYKKGI